MFTINLSFKSLLKTHMTFTDGNCGNCLNIRDTRLKETVFHTEREYRAAALESVRKLMWLWA